MTMRRALTFTGALFFRRSEYLSRIHLGVTIMTCWAALFGWSMVRAALPASWWFAPGTVVVADAPAGTCNPMSFDRDIHREFQGSWYVSLERQNKSGKFSAYRNFDGDLTYDPEKELPDELDLCWWIERDEIAFRPGVYRITTNWIIYPPNTDARSVRRRSNAFRITEPASD